jgi:uncharacterized protein YndB with AHSA1/START domain
MTSEVGHTQDAGWEIGVSRTVPFPRKHVWDVVTSPAGLAIWLGEGAKLEPDKGTPYETNDGTTGEVRGYRELDRVRVTHRLTGTDEETTVQVTVSDAATGKTVLRFHQERMASREQRERQRGHWEGVMQRLVAALER